ncbi:MAG: DsrE family protein [Bacteroidetes bacterium]|nr:DsrE family protein [Bacteroidota bacterium]
MKYKAVIQLSSGEDAVIKSTASQIHNLLKDLKNEVEIELVCHGKSLSFVTNDQGVWNSLIEDLLSKSVKIVACENMLIANAKSKNDLFAGIETVPAAIAELVVKQQQGWSYIKAGF